MRLAELQGIDPSDLGTWPVGLKFIGILVICVVLLAAGWFFVVKGQTEQLTRLENKEQQLKKTFRDKKKLALNLPAYLEQMEQMQESFGVMLRQLPDQTEVPELLVDITQAGLGRGLEFVLFKPQDKQYKDFYAELPISLKVVGDYHQLAEFVSDLAALPRIVTLGNIDILPDSNNRDVLTMAATTRTFHYLDPEEIATRRAAKEESQTKGKSRRKKNRKKAS